MANRAIGSPLDDVLAEEGILEECDRAARQRVAEWERRERRKARKAQPLSDGSDGKKIAIAFDSQQPAAIKPA